MVEINNIVSLKGGTAYVTNDASSALKVKSGEVLIYIVPIKNGNPGRRSFIYEASAGEVFPSFSYRDMEFCQWSFCVVAVDEAKIEIVENGATKALKQKFSSKARIKNYNQEGFEGGLVDQYRINTVTEDGFIRRTQRDRKDASNKTLNLIFSAFHKNELVDAAEKTNAPLYNAMSLLCEKQRILIAPFAKIKEVCGNEPNVSDIARISHFAYREIILETHWHKQDCGPLLVFDEKHHPMVCLPNGKGYILYDVENNVGTPVSATVAQAIMPKAFMIYRPLPLKKSGFKDVIRFCLEGVRTGDALLLAVLSIVISLIGLLTPTISQKLYDEYIPLGTQNVLFQMGCLLASFMISNILFSVVKNITSFRITSRMAYDVQGAIYDRTFNLPESFFRGFDSAELAQYIMGAGNIVNTVASITITSIVAGVYLIVYLVKMIRYSGKLSMYALLMILIYLALYYLIANRAIKYKEQTVVLEAKTSSLIFQFLNGIAKIRIAGAEDRVLYEYFKPYVKLCNTEAKKNTIVNVGEVLAMAANTLFSIVLYYIIIKGKLEVSLGSFVAFNTVFGSFSAYALQVVQGIVGIKEEMPAINRLKRILQAEPECDEAKEIPGELSGGIEINNVTFAYSEDSPNVLENLNLEIKPGEYVGIVGPSGCGKSTLMKLLLGFEKPSLGNIYYDNKDIENIDKRELRKKLGVVLQDGKLISGSIFENITITAPKATVADVQKVIKAVGLQKDIQAMPMGLHTMLSEDCRTISGGQQQRILIARAIISNPKIVFFDEATSALDNITQRMVCDTLEEMDATRIVIAHRLSTVINCDRILVLDKGGITEQGTYSELMAKKGMFYQLASRQLV